MKQIILTTMLFIFSKQYVNGQYLHLYGIPEIAEENSVFRLRCRRPGVGLLFSKATFRRNGTDVATVKWGGFWSQSSCRLSVHNGESGYGCQSSTRTKTLVIRHINKSRDSNSEWHCKNDDGWSNKYILPVKMDPPQCVLTTSINYNKSGDPEAGDQGDGNQLVLSEGDDLYLNCSASVVSGNHTNNEITYQWKIYGDKDEIYNGSDYGISNITRLDGAMYMCTASIGSYCTSSDVTYIQIQYPLSLNVTVNDTSEANVTVNDTSEAIELICRVVDGYPTNFTMHNWRHHIDGQFVREIEGVTTEDRTALVLNNNILNAGTYVCNASNGIKDFKGSVYQTDETYINIEAPPLALDDGQVIEVSEQSDVQIKATFIIGGDAYNTTWYIQQQNSSNLTEISVDTNSENGIRPININGTVINKNVTIVSGNVTISKMVDLTVTVTVCTQYGCTDSYQHVAVSSTSLISSNDELPINVPVIAGGVVGAVVLIGLTILIIVLVRRRPTNKNCLHGGEEQQDVIVEIDISVSLPLSICDNIECKHGGTCFQGVYLCPAETTGKFCEVTPCHGVECANGGQCVGDGIRACVSGYSGQTCNMRVCNVTECVDTCTLFRCSTDGENCYVTTDGILNECVDQGPECRKCTCKTCNMRLLKIVKKDKCCVCTNKVHYRGLILGSNRELQRKRSTVPIGMSGMGYV